MRKTQKSMVLFLIGAILFTFSVGIAEYRLTPFQAIKLEIKKNNLEKAELIKRFNTKQSSYFLYETEKEYLWFGVSRTGFLWRIDENHIYSGFNSYFGEVSGSMIIKEKNKDKDIIFSYGNERSIGYHAYGFTPSPKTFVMISHADDNTMISLNDNVFEKNSTNKIAPNIYEIKETLKQNSYEDKDGYKNVYMTNNIIYLENSRGIFKVNDDEPLLNLHYFEEESFKTSICKDEICKKDKLTNDYQLLDNVSSSIWLHDLSVEEFKKETKKLASLSLLKTEESADGLMIEMVKKDDLYYFISEREHEVYDYSTNQKETNKSYSIYRIYDEAVKDVLLFFESKT